MAVTKKTTKKRGRPFKKHSLKTISDKHKEYINEIQIMLQTPAHQNDIGLQRLLKKELHNNNKFNIKYDINRDSK